MAIPWARIRGHDPSAWPQLALPACRPVLREWCGQHCGAPRGRWVGVSTRPGIWRCAHGEGGDSLEEVERPLPGKGVHFCGALSTPARGRYKSEEERGLVLALRGCLRTAAAADPAAAAALSANSQGLPTTRKKKRRRRKESRRPRDNDNASSALGGAAAALCKLPEFEHAALNATVVVFAWRRLASLQRLLRSLSGAVYCGRTQPLVLMADAGADAPVVELARSFAWEHGPKQLVLHGGPPLGVRGMWIQMFRSHPGRHLLPLEDDVELSPLWYWWLLRVLHQYEPLETEAQLRAHRLAGVALYTPRLNEMQYPQAWWRARREGGTQSPAFLLQVPCSWGALIFSAYVADFLAFYDVRAAPPFYNFSAEQLQTGAGRLRQELGDWRVRLPDARCNVWARSWKRFLIDFMFGRGLVMLYPSFAQERCFATTYMERGIHSGRDGKQEAVSSAALRTDLDPTKTPPLFGLDAVDDLRRQLDDRVGGGGLPTWAELPVFSLHHQRRNDTKALEDAGAAFLHKVRLRGEATDNAPRYRRLVELWGRRGGGRAER